MRATIIYALVDSSTHEIRYVGKTVNPTTRMCVHKGAYKNTRKDRWIKSLRGKVEMIPLEEVGQNWVEAECFWIAYFKSMGARLTNHTLGGEGTLGRVHSEQTRFKISEKRRGKPGHPHSKETRAKMAGSHPAGRAGLKGAAWNKGKRKWDVRARVDGKRILVGRFDTKEEAHEEYVRYTTEKNISC